MAKRTGKFYSDECGGPFTAVFEDVTRPGFGDECGTKTSYEIAVKQGRKVVWKPRHALCTYHSEKRHIVEDVQGFFESYGCGRLPSTGTVGRAPTRRRKRRR